MWEHKMVVVFSFIVIIAHLTGVVAGGPSRRKNVLFLVSDDMRPNLGAYYGPDFPSPVHPKMHSPHLDKLASRSLLLKRAYVQQSLCSPSRTSLLTGRRPDTTHVYDLVNYFRKVGGNFTTIPQYFKENGYASIGIGKIFHPGSGGGHDDPISWSVPYYQPHNQIYWGSTKHGSWYATSEKDVAKYQLPDTLSADHAIKVLNNIAPQALSGEQPFFLAVGFHKPHMPFIFPKEFLQLYPPENIRVPDNQFAPSDMPSVAWSFNGEVLAYPDIQRLNYSGAINTSLPGDVVRDLRRAYYSAISYTDSLVGRVVNELDRLGLSKDTIISFWGDHGWQLGEHGVWGKITNFELANHAPMMVHIPGVTDRGLVTEQLTEYVDLFPTLAEAAGLPPLPLCPADSSKTETCTEGSSLMPLITQQGVLHAKPWKSRVFSQFPRGNASTPIMGYSMRTQRYRYTEWVRFQPAPKYQPDWNVVYGIELYDHGLDPEENHNRAYEKPFLALRKQLSAKLHAGWRAAIPN